MKISVEELHELLAEKERRIGDLTQQLYSERVIVRDLTSQVLVLQDELQEYEDATNV